MSSDLDAIYCLDLLYQQLRFLSVSQLSDTLPYCFLIKDFDAFEAQKGTQSSSQSKGVLYLRRKVDLKKLYQHQNLGKID